MVNRRTVAAFFVLCYAYCQMVLRKIQSTSSTWTFSFIDRTQWFVFNLLHSYFECLCWHIPSSYATANLNASCGLSSGCVPIFSCFLLLFMFGMSMSMITLSVLSPKSHFDAGPVYVCHIWRNVSFEFCSAASSCKSFLCAASLGWGSSTGWSTSITALEYLASAVTMKKFHHFSHSVLGALYTESQMVGNPDRVDDPPGDSNSTLDDKSRSTMLWRMKTIVVIALKF